MKVLSCFLLLVLLQVALSRPTFDRDVHATADADGIFRSSSLKRSQGLYALEYTAKIAQGVVSLDKDQAVEEIRCHADALIIKTSEAREWTVGNILAGGPEWGCKDVEGQAFTIAFKVSKVQKSGDVYRVYGSHVKVESLFEHLELSYERSAERQLVSRQAAPITFTTFPSTVVPGKVTRITFTIDATKITGSGDIVVEWFRRQGNETLVNATTIATVKGSTGSFDWTAPDVANPVIPSFFRLSQGTTAVESPAFFIEKVAAPITWNMNSDKTATLLEYPLFNATCATADYCKDTTKCPSCKIDRVSYLNFACYNCTATFNSAIHKFSIQSSSDAVTNFTFDGSFSFVNYVAWQWQTNFEWVGSISKTVLTNSLVAAPQFSVAGLPITLSVTLDLAIAGSMQSPAAVLNGSIWTRSNATWDIIKDNAGVRVNAKSGVGRPHSPLYGDGPYLAFFRWVPTVRVAINNNNKALVASIDQYYYADYRFGNPLPPLSSQFPLPNGDWKWSSEICVQPHYQEQWEWDGLDTKAEVNLGGFSNFSTTGKLHDFASGCDWLLEAGDHIYITVTQAGVSKVVGSVRVEVRKEVGIVLGMADANMLVEDQGGNTFRIAFLSNIHGWSQKLAAAFGDKNSLVYKQPLLKDATYKIDNASGALLPSLLVLLFVMLL